MLIACFGLHKSASTFAFRLACAASERVFDGEVIVNGKVTRIAGGFLRNSADVIESTDKVLVQKTHAGTVPAVRKPARDGHLKVIASIRDPRDIALSMLDAGKVERAAGRMNTMAKVETIDDAIAQTRDDIDSFMRWASLVDLLVIPYVEISSDPNRTVARMIKYCYGIDAPQELCAEINDSISRDTIRLNRGVHERYAEEMSEQDSQRIKDAFAEFYEDHGDQL